MPDLSLTAVLPQLLSNPVLLIIFILSIGIIVLNGAHDASNAIATCVATRSMSPGLAIGMAAIFNFLGVVLMTSISTAVAKTIFKMVNFSGNNEMALIALAAAMVAIVIWGVGTWMLGIPSSQSHALVAGLTGAAIALQGGLSGVNQHEWVKVIYGLVFSTGLGFLSGWALTKLIAALCRNIDYRKAETPFARLQDIAAAVLAFMHGAQDGQKFMTVLVLGVILAMGYDQNSTLQFPMWIMILSAASMSAGTAIGGKKIIKTVGMDMVKLEKWQGFSATAAASVCIYISTITGLPISTTHTKTTAIMGVGTAKRASAVNWSAAKDMIWAWVFTFPGCGIIGFVLAKVFMAFV
ncbi:MAG: inorganic phosphate transporter [Actinobacteria bacterium]|nr:inorganic phosphate transporter [Actinomycetota bacterium]